MILIALCGSLVGATIGTRLKVFALFPLTFIGLVPIATLALTNGSGLSFTLGLIAIWAVCLQLGYLGGLFTSYCLVAIRRPAGRPSPYPFNRR